MSNTKHTVIDATTGHVALSGATDDEFDRWYDHHCFWREPRDIAEVNPELRGAFMTRDELTHFLVNE